MLLEINVQHPEPRKIQRAAAALSDGEIIAYPTDTVYGLGCDLLNKSAVEKLYQLKRMPKTQALALEVFDPSYFIDFKLDDKDPVTLVGAPANCKLNFQRPNDGSAQAQSLRIGASTTIGNYVLPRLLAGFMGAQQPGNRPAID